MTSTMLTKKLCTHGSGNSSKDHSVEDVVHGKVKKASHADRARVPRVDQNWTDLDSVEATFRRIAKKADSIASKSDAVSDVSESSTSKSAKRSSSRR